MSKAEKILKELDYSINRNFLKPFTCDSDVKY